MKNKKNNFLGFLSPFLGFIAKSKDLTLVALIIAILSIIIVPLPSYVLDFFLTLSISISVLILLISLYVPNPTDLTTFPTLILIITLYRLSLNIATTRMILSKGHEGPSAVSSIIDSFGQFVVGGNYVIGVIVFSILVIINFIVVTKGSTRVAEVAARFTLDAMPGKQMAIDADLNTGLIDEPTARKRRETILQEANFYGAMDGSSKFVKGDAIAGIIITIINIIGGFLIGMFQYNMDLSNSAKTFTILTIGDGLVSQIPALIVSTATGIIITRSSGSKENFAEGVINQLINEEKTLYIVGFILVLFALVPGLPTASLLFVGFLFLILGYFIKIGKKRETEDESSEKLKLNQAENKTALTPEEEKKIEEQNLEEILKQEILELDLGYQLVKLADPAQGGDILSRIKNMRKKIATDYGFLIPQVRIRDNLQLEPNNYQIILKGIAVGNGTIYADKFMAMDSGLATEEINGISTKEPAFGLDAIWIDADEKDDAIMKGYTVIDPATVISTHMSELIKKYAEDLLSRQEVSKLIENVKKDYPIVVEDCFKVANIGLIQKVLKALLHEKIPIKDMLTILETISDVAEITKNIDIIVEQVRAKLSRVITNLYKNDKDVLQLATFNTETEQKLLDRINDKNGTRELLLNIGQINSLVETMSNEATKILQKGIAPVILIVDPLLRKSIKDIFEKFGLDVVVLSHAEIDPNVTFEVIDTIEIDKLYEGTK